MGHHSPQLHRDLKQARRLSKDQVEVLFFIDQVTKLLHLQQLAFDHLLRERDQQIENAKVPLFQGAVKGLHVQPVAGQNTL